MMMILSSLYVYLDIPTRYVEIIDLSYLNLDKKHSYNMDNNKKKLI
jgi:hypothetical protein